MYKKKPLKKKFSLFFRGYKKKKVFKTPVFFFFFPPPPPNLLCVGTNFAEYVYDSLGHTPCGSKNVKISYLNKIIYVVYWDTTEDVVSKKN